MRSVNVKWRGYGEELIAAEVVLDFWPSSARVPDEVGDNKFHKHEFNALYTILGHTLRNTPQTQHMTFTPWKDGAQDIGALRMLG